MAKSTKHVDKIGSLDDFRAPWQTESGSETEIDKTPLRRLIYNLKLAEAKALDARDDAVADLEVSNTERDDFKKQAESSNGEEASKKISKLERENDELKTKVRGFEDAAAEAELRSTVLGELPAKYARYVTGDTEEKLKASLKQVAEDFGFKLNDKGEYVPEADGDEDDEPAFRTQPRSLVNPLDPAPDTKGEPDYDKIAAQIVPGRTF